jgi:hypothetical protein
MLDLAVLRPDLDSLQVQIAGPGDLEMDLPQFVRCGSARVNLVGDYLECDDSTHYRIAELAVGTIRKAVVPYYRRRRPICLLACGTRHS